MKEGAWASTICRGEKSDQEGRTASVSSEVLRASFRSEEGVAKWERCCQASYSCCREMLNKPWPQGHCPNTWDGWQCWNATPPSTQARMPCPSYAYYGKVPSCTKEATKQCEGWGLWYRKKGREWSDYGSCGVQENIKLRLYVHIAAYSVSVAALLPALCIFFSYKQLRAHRFTLHKNLFLSLLLEAIGSIALRSLQLSHNSTIQKSPGWCVSLTLLTRYTSLSNYMWYLSEGFYLHKLLVSAFAEQSSLHIFYVIGWGFPLVAVGVYSVARGLTHPNTHCWILPCGPLEWIINIPPLLAILINIVFLVNIIRILVSKVRATSGTEPSQYRFIIVLFELLSMRITTHRWNEIFLTC
ncbi:hypothetical protein Pmani_018642 [Petrolisthes manimaculis]|uniref:Calcitonin receptor n=1 Tax=Petrolisthes manimaculis TaxID=1843537 RepID=A0AAE1PMG6_9EUCA|nr:hypothetical protein Pmani_018642 [Petrolisthes manimaculis]